MDRDTWIVENVAPKNKDLNAAKVIRRNIKPIEIINVTRKTKLTLCVLGYWAIYMPPYNIARLSSLTRSAGYHTRVFDFNIESYHDLQEINSDFKDSYQTANYWQWNEQNYYKKIFPWYKPILEKYIDKILEEDSDIIGFSTYSTNILTTRYVISEIKKRKPNVTIILGGPECAEGNFTKPAEADYYFVGESEQNILDFLNSYENGKLPTESKIGGLYSDVRIDIDSLPYPDYSDFDLEKYISKNSVCAEISRGCVARCTYCSEVWYWKFRDRGASTVVDELEYQVKTYGIQFVNFVDSLMNGNLKEFRKFCEELIKRDLKINWWGYARINGKMDLEFYKLMAKAGCLGFNYGLESGSDNVLKAVNKKNTVAEINQNLVDSEKVGMLVNACWVIGAPGEDREAVNHSLNCLWNHRKRIAAVSPGPGLGDNMGSTYDDRARFNMNERHQSWLNGWYTLDFTNTKLHRYIRIKLTHIWLDICREFNGTLLNIHSVGDIKRHYNVEFEDDLIINEINYETFDFNMINSDLGSFPNGIMNEVFSLLRLLWRVKGGYKINIRFNPTIDNEDFVFCLDTDKQEYYSDINFSINDSGNYKVSSYYKFVNLDKVFVRDKDFEYTHTTTGKWHKDNEISKQRQVFKKLDKLMSGPLPLESIFSSVSVNERNFLKTYAKYLPNDSVVVEGYSSLGGRAAILGHANPNIEIHSFEKFENNTLNIDFSSMQGWVQEQLNDMCLSLNIEASHGSILLNEVATAFSEDETGVAVWKNLTSKFNNITLHSINSINDLDWNKQIDCCLLKIYDQNDLSENVDFWTRYLKPTGDLIFHPYDKELSMPTYNVVNSLLETGWKIDQSCERLVVLKRI